MTAHATLNGVSQTSTATITISSTSVAPPSSSTGFLGLPDDDGYYILGAIIAVVVIGVIVALLRRKPRTPAVSPAPSSGPAPEPPRQN